MFPALPLLFFYFIFMFLLKNGCTQTLLILQNNFIWRNFIISQSHVFWLTVSQVVPAFELTECANNKWINKLTRAYCSNSGHWCHWLESLRTHPAAYIKRKQTLIQSIESNLTSYFPRIKLRTCIFLEISYSVLPSGLLKYPGTNLDEFKMDVGGLFIV